MLLPVWQLLPLQFSLLLAYCPWLKIELEFSLPRGGQKALFSLKIGYVLIGENVDRLGSGIPVI